MKIMAIDPDAEDLLCLSESIRRISPPGTSVECFRDPLFAHQYACLNQVDVLYAAAEMGHMSGFDMAHFLCGKYPQMYIYLLGNSDALCAEALRSGADGYILKPATPDALRKAHTETDKGDAWER